MALQAVGCLLLGTLLFLKRAVPGTALVNFLERKSIARIPILGLCCLQQSDIAKSNV